LSSRKYSTTRMTEEVFAKIFGRHVMVCEKCGRIFFCSKNTWKVPPSKALRENLKDLNLSLACPDRTLCKCIACSGGGSKDPDCQYHPPVGGEYP